MAAVACSAPSGYVADDTDCNDGDANEFPGQAWYSDFDGDGYSGGSVLIGCERPDGYRLARAIDEGRVQPYGFRSMQLADGPDGSWTDLDANPGDRPASRRKDRHDHRLARQLDDGLCA